MTLKRLVMYRALVPTEARHVERPPMVSQWEFAHMSIVDEYRIPTGFGVLLPAPARKIERQVPVPAPKPRKNVAAKKSMLAATALVLFAITGSLMGLAIQQLHIQLPTIHWPNNQWPK